MEKPFELTKTGPALTELIQGEEFIQRITASANSRRQRRPVLVAWSFRIEKQLHADLQKAADKIKPIAMSDIVNGSVGDVPADDPRSAGVAGGEGPRRSEPAGT